MSKDKNAAPAPEQNESEAKIAELTADLQRTRADFENFRRQAEAQKIQYANVVKNTTVAKILPLLDDLDRAIAVNESLKPLEKSLEKTQGEHRRCSGLSETPGAHRHFCFRLLTCHP